MLSKRFFMHLIAWYLPSLTFCALSTSEKVPSPFLATNRYLRMPVHAGLSGGSQRLKTPHSA